MKATPLVELEGKLKTIAKRIRKSERAMLLNSQGVSLVASDDPPKVGDEWMSPSPVIEFARQLMGSIDLDPASSVEANETIKAKVFYDKKKNGLNPKNKWAGNVWMNPPYSSPSAFVERVRNEYHQSTIDKAVVLLNSSTETRWYQIMMERFPALLLNKRLKFRAPQGFPDPGTNRYAQTLFFMGIQMGEIRHALRCSHEIGGMLVQRSCGNNCSVCGKDLGDGYFAIQAVSELWHCNQCAEIVRG